MIRNCLLGSSLGSNLCPNLGSCLSHSRSIHARTGLDQYLGPSHPNWTSNPKIKSLMFSWKHLTKRDPTGPLVKQAPWTHPSWFTGSNYCVKATLDYWESYQEGEMKRKEERRGRLCTHRNGQPSPWRTLVGLVNITALFQHMFTYWSVTHILLLEIYFQSNFL